MEFDFQAAVKDCREQIEYAAANSPQSLLAQRPCPICGRQCRLITGRHSRKSFFSHPFSNCIYDTMSAHLFFDSREEAMTAERIFE